MNKELQKQYLEGRRALIRRRLRNDPDKFLTFCNPGFGFKPFHHDWFELQRHYPETLVLAPRGHGKTTVCTCSFALYHILFRPDIRILIVSRTADQAQTIASEIKNKLSAMEEIQLVFGSQQGHPWTNSSFTICRRNRIRREPTVSAMGVCGPLTSKHFDLILCDDVLDFENTRTRSEREKISQWVGTALEPTLDPGGEIHWVGTRYHAEDYYARLLDHRIYSRCRANDESTSQAILKSKPPAPLWPERFTLQPEESDKKINLAEEKRKKGEAIFNAQYMNDVHHMSGNLFKPEWIKRHHGLENNKASGLRVLSPDDHWLPIDRIVQGFDPAIASGANADYSAHVTLGIANDPKQGKRFVVLEAMRDRLSFEAQVRLIQSLADKWSPTVIGIEEVAYQKALVQELRRRTDLPVKGISRRTDKLSRAYAIQGLLEEGRVWFSAYQTDLIEELAQFPEGVHDDLFDALETAISLARNIHKPAYW